MPVQSGHSRMTSKQDWLEMSIQSTPELVEPVSELFQRYGDAGVVVQLEGDWDPDNDQNVTTEPSKITVITYLKVDSTIQNRTAMIEIGIRLISHIQPLGQLESRTITERDWENAWKGHFTLLRIGKRIVLKPTWEGYKARPTDIVVELDPGMAFGTGHHPTTRMCLEELERYVSDGSQVLDVGIGSGILSIAAAKLGASQVVGLDIEDAAVEASLGNAKQNDVSDKIQVYKGSLPHSALDQEAFDIVVANLTANVITGLAQQIALSLRSQGVLIASGIITDRQPETEEAIAQVLTIKTRRYDGDWVLLVAQKES